MVSGGKRPGMLRVDQVGRFELMGVKQPDPLTISKKKRFLGWFRKLWPNMTQAAYKVGVSRRSIVKHMDLDPVFGERVQEIIDLHVDATEANVVKFAKQPKNFMDRMAVLRHARPEEWDPARKLIVQHERFQMTPDSARSRLTMVNGAIDAEVVQAQFPPEELKQLEGGE